MAPEVMTAGRVSKASDVYAVSGAAQGVGARGGAWPGTCWPAEPRARLTHTSLHPPPSPPQFGILLWELFTGQHAFKGIPRALLGHEVAYQQRRPQFPEGCPFDYQLLACR
jgi:hypothetical protein